jgi:hypothetical protein
VGKLGKLGKWSKKEENMEKKLVDQIEETYEDMRIRKNDWCLILFCVMLVAFAITGMYGLVNLLFGWLNDLVIKIILTLSLFVNFVTIFVIFDKEE